MLIGGFLAFAGGIGVAATSTETLPIIFGSVVPVGGALTTIAGCIKDWNFIIKCCWQTSNLDNLNRQNREKETRIRNKLNCCLKEACQMQNGEIRINIIHLKAICESVNFLGQGTKITSEIKELLVDIFKNSADLLDDELLKDVIPNDVEIKARQEIRGHNQEVSPLNRPQSQTPLESFELSNS